MINSLNLIWNLAKLKKKLNKWMSNKK